MTEACDCWTDDIWRAIHILARISSIKEKEEKAAFCTLILSLNRLISCPTIEKEVVFFMDNQDNDMMKYVSSNDRLFQWTVILRAHINKKLGKDKSPTLAELTSYYNPQTLTKDIWGPTLWKFIHNSVLRAPLEDNFCTPKISISMKAFITCISILLPCPQCRKHSWEYYTSHSIDEYLSTNLHAFEWTVLFHNEVTKRLNEQHGLNKKLYKAEEAIKFYAELPSTVNISEKFINNPEVI